MVMGHGSGRLILVCCAIMLYLGMIKGHCRLRKCKDGLNRMVTVC